MLYLNEMMESYKTEKNWKIKRALLVLCNAMYREQMGFGVEVPVKSEPIVMSTPVKPRKTIDEMRFDYNYELTSEEILLGKNQGKISCIKAFRTRTGEGLVNAKDFVEWFFDHWGYKFR